MNLPGGLGAHLGKGFDPSLAGLMIRMVPEYRLAPVAAIHDVVDPAGILDAELAGHDARVGPRRFSNQYRALTPLACCTFCGLIPPTVSGKR